MAVDPAENAAAVDLGGLSRDQLCKHVAATPRGTHAGGASGPARRAGEAAGVRDRCSGSCECLVGGPERGVREHQGFTYRVQGEPGVVSDGVGHARGGAEGR